MLKNILKLEGVSQVPEQKLHNLLGGGRECVINQASDKWLYLECVNDDGSIQYYDTLGKEIFCGDIEAHNDNV